MVKLSILYHQPADENAFELRYNQNLALMEQLPGIRRRQACVVLGNAAGRSPYCRILELYFENYPALDEAMRSTQGQQAGADLMQFAKDSELIFSEVYED